MSNIKKIILPQKLTPASICKFGYELSKLESADGFDFDFGQTRWFPPFSMILLAMHLRQFGDLHPNSELYVTNHENHQYAAHMGFFKTFGLDHGNEPGEAKGSERYIPIQSIKKREISEKASQEYVEKGEIIERKAASLSTILTQTNAGIVHDTLTYSIREILRNAFEHSCADEVLICAQHWPSKNEVEVGIIDAGIGIKAGLGQNPNFRFETDRESINTALMPGVSGNISAGKGSNPWMNTGYGLYMTNRICRAGGCFFICSGNAGVWLEKNRKLDIHSNLKGTAVRLHLDTSKLSDLKDRLAGFHKDGIRAAKEIKGANKSYASAASQMLTRDFQ
ncbi:ATP-binding protein [Allorhizobium terrae]|uniref:ATP-binding protein n=1 Tax=Allorhizobium terrae TaxID=1848972 RepID=A0A4S4A5P4_9HYPH|nr:ATP-binding protein [Allorhizobium terrae]THF53861.1 ATP-binding protein [Allorhizobium terrae]